MKNQSGKISIAVLLFLGLGIFTVFIAFPFSKAQATQGVPSLNYVAGTPTGTQTPGVYPNPQPMTQPGGGSGGGGVGVGTPVPQYPYYTPLPTATPIQMSSLVLPNQTPVALPTVTGKGYYLEEVDIPSTSSGNTIVLTGGTSPLTVILPSNQSFNTNDNAYPFLPVYFTAASSAITWTQTGTSSINIPYKAYTK